MPQPLPVLPFDYGRRTSRLALASLLLALSQWLLFGVLVALFLLPRLAGPEVGVWWVFAALGLIVLVFRASPVLVLLSIGLGAAGLWAIRGRPDLLRGRWLAWLGIALSIGAWFMVAAARGMHDKWNQASQRGAAPATVTP